MNESMFPKNLMTSENLPGILTFDGGDTYEGWIHETYRQYPDGTETFEVWDSGGYQNGTDQEEEEMRNEILKELGERFIKGEEPLPKWSNKVGWTLWLACQSPKNRILRLDKENSLLHNQISRRNKQIRDLRKVLTTKK